MNFSIWNLFLYHFLLGFLPFVFLALFLLPIFSQGFEAFFKNVPVPSVTSLPNGIISGVPVGMLVDKLINTARFLLFPNLATLSMGEYVKTFLTGENDTWFDMIILIKNYTMTTSFYTIFPINWTTNHTLFSFVNMDQEEKRKLLHLIQEANQIIEDLMQLFERTEKSLHLIKEIKKTSPNGQHNSTKSTRWCTTTPPHSGFEGTISKNNWTNSKTIC